MYYSIHDFMFGDLELCGTDLNVFALIYSFKEYKGSLQSICSAVGVKSITTVQSSLNRLLEQDLLIKEKSENKFLPCIYKVNFNHKFIPRSTRGKEREWDDSVLKDDVQIGVKL